MPGRESASSLGASAPGALRDVAFGCAGGEIRMGTDEGEMLEDAKLILVAIKPSL